MRYIILLGLLSCYNIDEECVNYSTVNIEKDYKIKNAVYTPSGIAVDADGMDIDLNVVDRLTDEVYNCLATNFPTKKIPDDLPYKMYCTWQSIHLVKRSCIKLKIPNDYTLSCDGTQQILQDHAPQAGCEAKGLTRDYGQCPCSWRAGISQGANGDPIIVSTPSLYLYKDPLVRYLTSCDYPWYAEQLAQCMTPTTSPLDLNQGNQNE